MRSSIGSYIYRMYSRTAIVLVFYAEKLTFPQRLGAFPHSDSAGTAAVLRETPTHATKYRHHGDHECLLYLI